MPEKEREAEPTIGEEAEAAARADMERFIESEIPRVSDQIMAAQLLWPMAGAWGFDPEKVPRYAADSLHRLREDLSGRRPPALEESRVPPSGVAPTED